MFSNLIPLPTSGLSCVTLLLTYTRRFEGLPERLLTQRLFFRFGSLVVFMVAGRVGLYLRGHTDFFVSSLWTLDAEVLRCVRPHRRRRHWGRISSPCYKKIPRVPSEVFSTSATDVCNHA